MAEKSHQNQAENTGGKTVRRSEYWTSVVVLVFVAAFFITIAALCYGIIATPSPRPGTIPTMAFPWIGWFAALLVVTAVILGFAQYMAGKHEAGEGPDPSAENAWASQLPDKALRVYRIIKDAPLFMICFALVALGATLLVIDGAFALASGIVLALLPYVPYFIGGITAFAIAMAALMAWFRHASNRLAAEYAFRREVMEKTGVILLDDKGKAILPPGGDRDRYAIGSVEEPTDASGPLIEAVPVIVLPPGGETPKETPGETSNVPSR
ncbi:MAG: hypothetical protein LIP28_07035 [Deltaproteobacteria bacterium]|nr:hypothetical protein [Deltaproteobacteria bacterium]